MLKQILQGFSKPKSEAEIELESLMQQVQEKQWNLLRPQDLVRRMYLERLIQQGFDGLPGTTPVLF